MEAIIACMIAILYYCTVIFILFYLISIFIYTCSLIVSALDGAPYVKTATTVRQRMFDHAHITNKSRFIEVGSGTGELAMYIQRNYHCDVIGLEVNPFLHYMSRLRNRLFGSKNIQFTLGNALHYDYSNVTHVYIFLLPAIIRKLHPVLKKTCKHNTILISYGFCIPPFKKYLIKKDNVRPYPIYYYKL